MQITQYVAEKDIITVAIAFVAANSIEEVSEVMTQTVCAGDLQHISFSKSA